MPRRLTTEEFVKQARAVYGDRYDYSQVKYVNANSKVTIICRDHGSFAQTPSKHIRAQGCAECLGEKRRLTTESFIERARKTHSDRYDYSQVNCVNSRTKVTIICRDHGSFMQVPSTHIWGKGCPDCGGRKKLTTETFIERAKKVHGDHYDYSKVEYANLRTKVRIICRDHGPFAQVPISHLGGDGCADCGGKKKLKTAKFIEKAKAIHDDRYDYSKVEYVNNQTKVTIRCRYHGPFRQNPSDHISARKRGCPDCGGSKPLTTKTFIEKAKATHGDRYDYSQVKYANTHTKVTIICLDHGPFRQFPNDHIHQNSGCPDCGGTKRLTAETFIEKAEAIHGDRYDYSQVEYANNQTKVTIICPDHGPFRQNPVDHISARKRRCPDCGGSKPLTTETFIEKAEAIHGDRYDYSHVNYVNAHTKVTIICPDHGPFRQAPTGHTEKKAGCADCADWGFNPSDPGLLYYLAITTDDGDTRYKIGITNRTVEERFAAPDLARIRIVKTWGYAVARAAAEREREILSQYAGDRYYGRDILVSYGNTELFTHDILGLDVGDEAND